MRYEHKKRILKRKELSAYHKAIRVFHKYRIRMNDCVATKKMMVIDKLLEASIRKAITFVVSEHHARVCIWEARKSIFKTEQKAYSPFVKVACGNIVDWRQVVGKTEDGEIAYCEQCEKLEEIIEVY
ncbi:hypothetical protein [Pelosinus propionicus]|uniref:Uncharacterized protein n=1 Tax=Pelosinus propionicus DSM 13327 TaxID=1123291 RepID=A0A1I4PTM1_9FIRM|nr:hypothetical protein [Pelosinus propionicus]SFM31109.1 hypothetical protein SAMN04490355_107228 [Pelosinus propionicus DSM 13327]